MINKKKLTLQVRQPALVRLAQTTIAFKGSSTNPEYVPVQGSLLATLETELISNERTLVKKDDPGNAEWVFDLKVTGFAAPPGQVRSQTIGNSTTTSVAWTGSINAAYQILDHSGRVRDASNVSFNYNRDFDQGSGSKSWIPILGKKPHPNETIPHTAEDLKQILLHEIVRQIAANLGNTTQPVEVQVATGEDHLSRSATFMEQHLWQRAIDELQGATPFPKEEEEAYRTYDLGLAYEALAYDSKGPEEERANMYKAAELYDKALEQNRKEKYFVEATARLKTSIARYKTLDEMLNEAIKPPPPKIRTLRATDVVDLYANGVPQDQILELIRDSPIDYDYRDIPTMLAIAKAKLPVPLQNELRKKVGAPLIEEPKQVEKSTKVDETAKAADAKKPDEPPKPDDAKKPAPQRKPTDPVKKKQ